MCKSSAMIKSKGGKKRVTKDGAITDPQVQEDLKKKLKAFSKLIKLSSSTSSHKTMEHFMQNFGKEEEKGMVMELFGKVKEIERSLNILSPDGNIQEQLKRLPDEKLKFAIQNYISIGPIKEFTNLESRLIGAVTKIANMKVQNNFLTYQYVQLNSLIPMFALAAIEILAELFNGMMGLIYLQQEKCAYIVESILKAIESQGDGVDMVALQQQIDQLRSSSDKKLAKILQDIIKQSKEMESASNKQLLEWLVTQSGEFRNQIERALQTDTKKNL